MIQKMDAIIQQNEDKKLVPRKLTSLERGRIALKFIQMNENPDKFVLDNRYVER
jgi:hypothetical protein